MTLCTNCTKCVISFWRVIRIFEKEGDDENQLCSELGPGDSEMNNKQSQLLINLESDKRRDKSEFRIHCNKY